MSRDRERYERLVDFSRLLLAGVGRPFPSDAREKSDAREMIQHTVVPLECDGNGGPIEEAHSRVCQERGVDDDGVGLLETKCPYCLDKGRERIDAATAYVDKTSMPFFRRYRNDFIGNMTSEDKLIWARWKKRLDQMVIGSHSALPPRPEDYP